jgi:hypothetical protein
MYKITIYILMMVSSVPAIAGFRSKLPVKWGKIDPAEFSIMPAGTDAAASAIVLCDYGDIEITNRTFYSRHTRIKILHQDGMKYATVEIPYQTRNRHDQFYELKAQTLLLVNGKVIEYKVAPGQIEDIRINERWSKKKFTFPHVEPGAVIEFKYKIASLDFEKLDSWYFQREIPTIWSEVRLNVPSPFVYLVSYTNNRQLAPDEEAVYGEKLQWLYSTKARKRRFELINKGYLLFNTNESRYKVWALNNMRKKIVMRNLPGLSGTYNDQPVATHYPQVRFDLFESSGNLPRMFRPLLLTTHENYETLNELMMMHGSGEFIGYVHFKLKTWSQFNESLLANERFGKYLMAIAGPKQQLSGEQEDELQRINAIYKYVVKEFTWNGQYAQLAQQDVKDFLKNRTGSSAEINLMFINLLRQHGIESDPLLIRTSELGLPEKMYPVKNQFNHVIAAVQIGGKTFLFDATTNSTELNRLNKADIGTMGWIVRKENPGWIETFETGTEIKVDEEIPMFNL